MASAMESPKGPSVTGAAGLFCLVLGIGLLIGYALASGRPSVSGGILSWTLGSGIAFTILGAIAVRLGFKRDDSPEG